ncbi:restriction endonuclease subunit S [Enterobacter cloacae]|uniref:restriction endonuclease subunit S n=1 Tax=Enterobacter cloacae TaxID=550 RepID=UPI00188C3E1D|nr:restriction endonuclease subunit S [Enterobacter cloacae]
MMGELNQMLDIQSIPDGYKQTEVGVIPEDWDICELQTAVDFLDGQRRPIKSGDRAKISGPYPYYGASGIVDYVNDYIFDDNLILLGEDGENILSRNLPLAFMVSGKIWVNNHAHVMKPKDSFDIIYLTEYLESKDYSLLNSGTAQPKLNKQTCLKIKVIKPTKKEQTAIAKVLSDTDALIISLEKLVAKKQTIKTATMQQLLTGRTRLPQFAKHPDGVLKGNKPSELGLIPEDWICVKLGEIGQCIIGLTYSPRDVSDTGTLVLRSSNVQNNKLAYQDNVFVNMDLPERVIVRKGDILICVRNGSRKLIGKCALIDHTAEGCAFGAFMAIYRTKAHDFIFYQFQSNLIHNQIDETMGATINQITNKDLSGFIISMPSCDQEQTAIATILLDMDAELEALEQKLAKFRDIKQGMMQQLLTGRIRLPLDQQP